MKKIQSAVKCSGDKYNICDWVISYFPLDYEKMTYVEPFCGSANVFLNKKKSKIEVINDTDASLIQIYHALRDEFKEFVKKLNCKYSEGSFKKASKKVEFEDYLDKAANEFILRKMSRNEEKKIYTTKNLKTWKNTLNFMNSRFKDAYIFNKTPLEIIKTFNQQDVLLYCNPPYLYEENTSKVYSSEMTPEDHIALSHVINDFNGKVIISGLASPLYNRLYKSWNVYKKKLPKQKEILWTNY